jgi:hypothetical protein
MVAVPAKWKPSMRSILSNVAWTFRNLFAGLRLTLPVPVSRQSFRFSSDQALILLLVACGATLLSTYFTSADSVRLSWFSWPILAARCFFALLLLYLVARLQAALETLPAIAVAFFSATAFIDLYQALMYGLVGQPAMYSWRSGGAGTSTIVVWVLVLAWGSATVLRAVRLVYGTGWLRTGLLSAVIILGSFGAGWVAPAYMLYVPRMEAEYRRRHGTHGLELPIPEIAQRQLRKRDGEHMPRAVRREVEEQDVLLDIHPLGDAGERELQVGHAGDGQLVHGPRIVDEDERAAARAEALVEESPGDARLLHEHVRGRCPGKAEEIMLDRSGIKWRILVISACYSGSFIDALKDDHTLIATAASKDRTSFGCGTESEFTYFGDAYINTALREDRSFISAFYRARAAVALREQEEGLKPSEPQIDVGEAMKAKLEQLEGRLAKVATQ